LELATLPLQLRQLSPVRVDGLRIVSESLILSAVLPPIRTGLHRRSSPRGLPHCAGSREQIQVKVLRSVSGGAIRPTPPPECHALAVIQGTGRATRKFLLLLPVRCRRAVR